MIGAVLAAIALSVTLQANRRLGLVTPAPPVTGPPTTTTTVPGNTTTGTGTTMPVTTTAGNGTTIPPGTTTPPLPPINITCPMDVISTLGKPSDVPALGNAMAVGGCTTPVVTSSDVVIGTVARSVPRLAKKEVKPKTVIPQNIATSGSSGTPHTGTCVGGRVPDTNSGIENVFEFIATNINNNNKRAERQVHEETQEVNPRQGARNHENPKKTEKKKKKKRTLRSPSFSSPHLADLASGGAGNTGVLPPDPVAAAGLSQIVLGVNSILGAAVGVFDKSFGLLGSFTLGGLGTGVCSGVNNGDPQVMYDQDADRWVLLELMSPNNTLCMFVSDTGDALGTYMEIQFQFDDLPDYPKLGLWNRVYSLTINIPPTGGNPNPENMCVIDRLAALAGSPTVPMFCAAPFNGPLAGFGFQAWTPVTIENGPLAPAATESSGTPGIGAVFMRHKDEELHDGSGSPILDFLEVEHWSNIDFNTTSYVNVRYSVPVSDFDSDPGSCTSSDECVPTPTPQELDPLREVVMHRAAYRYLPDCDNQESLVGAFVSHANGVDNARVRWFELRFMKPSPSLDPLFTLYQEGEINQDSQHRFMGTAGMDGNGTIAVGYALSSASTWPSMVMTTRVADDPLGMMRDETIVSPGEVAVIPSFRWGDYFSMSTDPLPGEQSRIFYFAGQRTVSGGDPWQARVHKMRVEGEIVERTFLAQDTCGQMVSCVQTIQLE